MYQDWMKDIPVLGDIEIKFNPDEYMKYWEECPMCREKVRGVEC